MQEIISAFGIDVRLIVIQVVNFGLLLLVLWYFLYAPVLAIIERRRQAIEQGVRDAERAAQKLAAAKNEQAAIVKAAHVEASGVALRAKAHAEEKTAVIVANAEAKSIRIITEAGKEALLLKERLNKEAEAEIAKMALLAAEKILRERT